MTRDHGYTLVELLVATAITMTSLGIVLGIVVPAQQAFAVQPEAADLHQRARVGMDRLIYDIRNAGTRFPISPEALTQVFAPILPYRVGATQSDAAAGVYHRTGVLSLISLGLDPATAAVRRVSRTYYVRRSGANASHLMQYDGEETAFPFLDDVVGLSFELYGDPYPPEIGVDPFGALRVSYGPAPPPVDVDDPATDWAAGENCMWTVVNGEHRTRLPELGAGGEPVRLEAAGLTDGPWCPDGADADRFDADLLRVRFVRVEMRLQARSSFRGARGALFVNPGTASGNRMIPDLTVRFDVGLRGQ